MPQLDLITFCYQFIGMLGGMGMSMAVLLWYTLPALKISRQARLVSSQELMLIKSIKEPLVKKMFQEC